MNKTNTGLVAHCEKALTEKWYYLWGTHGQIATQAVLDANIKQYPENEAKKSYASSAINKTRFSDCYGIIKSYLWWVDDESNPRYVASQDLTSTSAYNNASEKGTLSTLPEIPGIVLWMSGHTGVYTGNGRFIECAGDIGVSEGYIKNGVITKGSKFVAWFKDVNILYEAVLEDVEIKNAINVLSSNGIISTPEYWEQNYMKIKYLDLLIKNMAVFIQK